MYQNRLDKKKVELITVANYNGEMIAVYKIVETQEVYAVTTENFNSNFNHIDEDDFGDLGDSFIA